MYQVKGVNEYGQLFTDKGQIQHYAVSQAPCLLDFNSLESARRYAKSFVRRYPHVTCHVIQANDTDHIVETHRDEEFWAWKASYDTDLHQTNRRMNTLNSAIHYVSLYVVGIGLTLLLTRQC